MGHTPAQRDKHALCGAKTRSGGTCRKFAGESTEHPGTGRCKYHGGNTPSHRKNAVELEAKQRMVKMGSPIDGTRPHEALLGLLRSSAGHVAWLMREVGELDDLGTHEAKVILHLYDEERDRLTRVAKAASDAGVDQAEILVMEAQAVTMVKVLRDAAEDIGLSRDHVAALGNAMRMRLAEASGDVDLVARESERLAGQVARLRAADDRRVEKAAQKVAGLVPASEMGFGSPLPAAPAGT